MQIFNRPRLRLGAIILSAMAAGGLVTHEADANQPHMISARAYLNEAQSQLQEATPDKGGYRQQAIDLVQQALHAVNQGIAAGS
jgi:hypothetical protein